MNEIKSQIFGDSVETHTNLRPSNQSESKEKIQKEMYKHLYEIKTIVDTSLTLEKLYLSK